MMKKQMLSLVLSAAIFTTSPLLSMEPPQPEDEGKERIIHLCPMCELKFPDVANSQGNRLLANFPNEENAHVLAKLSLKEMLTCSTLSKNMHNLCQIPLVWDLFAQKERSFVPKPSLCIKSQFPSYLNLFNKWNNSAKNQDDDFHMKSIKYVVSVAQFKAFLRIPCDTTWWAYDYERNNPEVKSYKFSIGDQEFELYWSPQGRKSFIKNLNDRKQDIVFSSGYTHGYKDATSCQAESIYNVFYICSISIKSSIWVKKLETKKSEK